MGDSANTNGNLDPGVSIRNGPVGNGDVEMEDAPDGANARGAGKRKLRASAEGKSYAEPESSEEEDKPLSKRRRTSSKKQAADSDSDDVPLAQRSNGTKPPKASETAIGDESDSDVPIERKLSKEKAKVEEKAEKEAKATQKAEGGAATKKTTVKKEKSAKSTANGRKKQANGIKKESSDEETPVKAGAKKTSKSVKSEPATPAKKGKDKETPVKEETEEPEDGEEEEEEEEEEYRWWEDPNKTDGTIKWHTLEHNGVIFPPPYEPLPQHVKMKYDGIPVTLEPEAEEVAGFFGSMLNSTHNVENPTFQKNFFGDFQEVLKKTGGAKDPQGNPVEIKEFSKCDFRPIFEYYEMKRAEKRNMPAAEKKALKAQKEAQEAPYMYCLWDGRKQKVGNFRIEPPGLFRGRGEHPKTGKVKTRVQPEQVTINIGKEAKVPDPPPGHHWKEVRHDQECTWLAMWQENINGNYKYVMLAANSDIKGQSDYRKFEKARELKKHIDRIRKDYQKNLKHELMADRQKATAVYLIDKFALRAGNEKGEDEADTVGCCSLKYENVTLKPPNKVIFDFLGKDSIRFYDEVEVDPQVFKNLKIFKKPPKKEGDEIFDRLTTSALNKHLSSYMPGLTAKVFRTYNASWTFAKLLKEMKPGGSVAEKVKAYNDANRQVAILCNHKRTVTASHAGQMEKLGDRIKGLKYQKWRVKQMMLDLDPSIKKEKGADYFKMDEDLDEEWIKKHQAFLIEEQRQKITKKFEKENEKRAAEGQEELKPEVLEERLKVLKDMEKKFEKENKTGKVEVEGKNPTIEKLENNILKLEQRIETMTLQAQDKEDNKEVALGTSKINYIDPRLTVVFSKRFNVPIEKFFSKTLREKFEWAIKSVDETWEF
ncbi:2-alkenal reductase [Rasamsonia emersonii CBS 393.64]|uniref:DNA topoisomerase I n=1 Tax=Rasamsonia emersonii (strain ATCC 16479 / CBS 393.64 / IMI 116815) TaxID=1408163 RepID=A0A0F4Z3I4_RASE3|nr:2-alkenal reductase [Rasamsonia emersonii CBS 393.64]KKA25082.1 2-alkenal reductase [Rasamsonia emersonii CBS 393.64]